MRRVLIAACLLLILRVFTACGGRGDEGGVSGNSDTSSATSSMALGSSQATPILLFIGKGTSPGDVTAIEKILTDKHLNYSAVNSSQLNRMSESQLQGHRLLIVPGGNFINIGNGLTSNKTSNIRNAVRSGLNYLGICAGAFFAGDSGY